MDKLYKKSNLGKLLILCEEKSTERKKKFKFSVENLRKTTIGKNKTDETIVNLKERLNKIIEKYEKKQKNEIQKNTETMIEIENYFNEKNSGTINFFNDDFNSSAYDQNDSNEFNFINRKHQNSKKDYTMISSFLTKEEEMNYSTKQEEEINNNDFRFQKISIQPLEKRKK